jgi:biopolymer transport protein ExbD
MREMETDKKIILKYLSRRRKSKRGRMEFSLFESFSIGDLAFLLLIFFIVTSSFILREGIFFSLPSNSGSAVRVDSKQILDVYPENVGFRIDDRLMTRGEALEAFAAHKKSVDDAVVIIHMKEGVIYDRFVDTLSLAKETGIGRVSIRENLKE